ncbi:LacI family transcriptional regulator [Paenarthrobacter ureafaciens]|uniref:LacI family DNA-binding transcriptional regulator n=1 Tax=Paenarthrobacter ureafaciens TaxID=37931 RepID=UPI0015BEADA4|nr:LacI family transcriptional regulator [Paenarthrobacter ureafaciens]BCW82616.1 LacI family transcriptional regulator [Arthrobacter sp. NicSoilE8]
MDDEHVGVKVLQPTERRHPVTIYDIAREAGVSTSTVSRAFSKPERVSMATVKRVQDAATALGYRINPLASALPTGRTNTLGLLLSDITNPVYFELVRGAGRVAAEEGYTLVLAESQAELGLESQATERLLSLVDGLVLVETRMDDDEILAVAERKPVLLVNRTVPSLPHVIPDIEPGIKAAIAHLAQYGHHSIAFLSGPSNSWLSAQRWETILTEALETGMNVVEIGPTKPTFEGGAESLRRVRASGASAVLTFNDVMAMGLLTACEEAGVSIPDELSIIGYDNIFATVFTSPSLTTIQPRLGEAGEQAFRQIVRSLKGTNDETSPSNLATDLIIRKSTGRPHKK